jgi:intracellular multiplication protein IcmD
MRKVQLALLALTTLAVGTVYAATAGSSGGVGGVAAMVTSNFANLAKLITAGAYVAGMAFAVGAVVKFKAHKDNPTQIPIGTPIALLFVGAALIFVPTIFKVAGATMFGGSGETAGVGGRLSFGDKTGA